MDSDQSGAARIGADQFGSVQAVAQAGDRSPQPGQVFIKNIIYLSDILFLINTIFSSRGSILTEESIPEMSF